MVLEGSIALSENHEFGIWKLDLAKDTQAKAKLCFLSKKSQRFAKESRLLSQEATVSPDLPHPTNKAQGVHEASSLKPYYEALT